MEPSPLFTRANEFSFSFELRGTYSNTGLSRWARVSGESDRALEGRRKRRVRGKLEAWQRSVLAAFQY